MSELDVHSAFTPYLHHSCSGLCGVVASIGLSHMVTVVVGDSTGEYSRLLLDTGKVDRIYRIRSGTGVTLCDRRVADIDEPTLRASVLSGAVPGRVDMVYVAGEGLRGGTAVVGTAVGMCDFLAGDCWGDKSTRTALRVEVGRHPDHVFSGTSWVFSTGDSDEPHSGVVWHDSSTDIRALGDIVRDTFDAILFLTCPQSASVRLPLALAEFDRIGLGDIVLAFPNAHNAIANAELLRRRFANDGARDINVRNVTLGHYGMVRFARDAGYRRVLIMEDDCIFMRPLSIVCKYLSELPVDASATMYYKGIPHQTIGKMFPDDSPSLRWGRIPGGTFFDGSACYALSRDGMECLVDYYERCGTDGYKWSVDAADRIWPNLTASVKVYASRIDLATSVAVPSITCREFSVQR